MLRAAEFDGSLTPGHWRQSNRAGCIYAEEHATHRNGRSRFSDVLVA
jgi:hypothetical protein